MLLPTGLALEFSFIPDADFLSSIGCINPTGTLATPNDDIDFADSRKRMIAIIDDLKAFVGNAFPSSNGKQVPNASVVITAR